MHLMKVFMGNGYFCSLIRSASAPKPPGEHDGEREEERLPTVHLALVSGNEEREEERPPTVHLALVSGSGRESQVDFDDELESLKCT